MKAKNEILRLGELHAIETPHVAHVADLAMELYDGFSPLDGIQEKDRDLLQAAALLHDIGYASDPEQHADSGAAILEENPLACFSSKDWRAVVAVVRLHQRDWRAQLDNDWFAAFGHKRLERIKILAAILRIADGLDHGHIQDARVLYCRRGKRSDKAGIRWTWYPNNIPWAEDKADLWEAIFKRPFKFESLPEPGKDLYSGAVDKKDPALSAARKLLNTQYALMRDRLPGMLETCDPECLHDYRVAMRRFRMLLSMFRSVLPEAGVPSLDRKLDRMLDRLDPVRDAHVQLALFRTADLPEATADQVSQFLEAEAAVKNADLLKLLQSPACRKTTLLMGRFLRVEIPEKERSGAVKSFPGLADKTLHRTLRPLLDADVSAIRDHPAGMHAIRKLCRHGRYCAEFSAPALGDPIRKITTHLKTAATALGQVRDLQLQAELLKRHGMEAGRSLTERCEAEWQQFFTAWKKLIKRVNELK